MKLSPGLVAELTVNLLLPWAAYRAALAYWGETGGLVASAVPPLVWSPVQLARFRRVDALSALVLFGFVLSIAAALAGGSARMLLM
ncbi:VC0807 family protein, partial [Burkholderia pseudomallei]